MIETEIKCNSCGRSFDTQTISTCRFHGVHLFMTDYDFCRKCLDNGAYVILSDFYAKLEAFKLD